MKVDQIIRATFSIFDAAGAKVTGRAGVVTTNLQMDNAATAEVVTVAESSDVAGDYQASFTPLATGTYRLDVYDATYNPQGWFGSWEVLGSDDDSITADLVTVQADLDDPNQYKATGFAVPNEYDVALAAIQTDLDDPGQYKADVSLLALEATAQTLITDVAFIKSIEGGRWRITGNQMIFYASDNVTEVARFNLLDSGGSPAMTDVMERTRV